MSAGTYDILIEQGATFRMSATWKDSAGAPVNITGYTARMQVRRRYNDPTILLNFSTTNGAIVLGGSAGTITITGAATVTDDVAARTGVYDLELVSADGTVTRLLEGGVTISPEVTR